MGRQSLFGGLATEVHAEACAAAWQIQNGHLRTMPSRNLQHEIETVARASMPRLQPVKWLEYSLALCLGNAGTIVADLDHAVTLDPNDNRSPVSGMLDRIFCQVDDGTPERRRARLNERALHRRLI